jgi:hypothetical protein
VNKISILLLEQESFGEKKTCFIFKVKQNTVHPHQNPARILCAVVHVQCKALKVNMTMKPTAAKKLKGHELDHS